MATLTADEITDIRFVCGAENEEVLSDPVIQAQYDLATADAPESAFILPYTYVYLLRRLWAYQRIRTNRTTTHGDKQERQQIVDNSKALLDYWEGKAGLAGGSMRTGVLYQHIDYTQDDFDAEMLDE